MNIAISFILPIYNAQPYLKEAVDSILRQNVSKEIILVDDGSTDTSLEIALNYAQQYDFISVIHTQNRGVSSARNVGLDLAQGEYVHFLDPDDILDTHVDFSEIYIFAKQLNYQVIKGQYLQYNLGLEQDYITQKDPLYVRQSQPVCHQVLDETYIHTELQNFLGLYLNSGWYIQIGYLLINRQFLQHHQIRFNENLSLHEDGIFLAEILMHEGKIAEIPMILMHYRMHKNSTIAQKANDKHFSSHAYSIQYLIDKLQYHTGNLKFCIFDLIIIYINQLLQALEQAPPDFQQEYQHLVTDEIRKIYNITTLEEIQKLGTQ